MNDQFFLPVCFAAAVHGALLFGFSKPPRTPLPAKAPVTVTPFKLPVIEEETVVLIPDQTESQSKSIDAPAPPRSPEPVSLPIPGRQTMDLPPISRVVSADFDRTINLEGFGNGKGERPFGDTPFLIAQLDNTPGPFSSDADLPVRGEAHRIAR
jgi:hypothetical protein